MFLDQRSKTTVQPLKAQFARDAIPEVVGSDSCPQFCSDLLLLIVHVVLPTRP